VGIDGFDGGGPPLRQLHQPVTTPVSGAFLLSGENKAPDGLAYIAGIHCPCDRRTLAPAVYGRSRFAATFCIALCLLISDEARVSISHYEVRMYK